MAKLLEIKVNNLKQVVEKRENHDVQNSNEFFRVPAIDITVFSRTSANNWYMY